MNKTFAFAIIFVTLAIFMLLGAIATPSLYHGNSNVIFITAFFWFGTGIYTFISFQQIKLYLRTR